MESNSALVSSWSTGQASRAGGHPVRHPFWFGIKEKTDGISRRRYGRSGGQAGRAAPASQRWRAAGAAGDGASRRRTRPWRPPGSGASRGTSATCTAAWTSAARGPWSRSATGTPPRPSPSAPLPRRWRPSPPPSAPVISTATRPATRISQLAG